MGKFGHEDRSRSATHRVRPVGAHAGVFSDWTKRPFQTFTPLVWRELLVSRRPPFDRLASSKAVGVRRKPDFGPPMSREKDMAAVRRIGHVP